ncbi:hypothetical protein [Phyllobacterium zundukense]|uniref:Uncharacterized protein n=1 Tax=Phyllobacterium zundukense TaxID=1867719 RepID=A0A2N9W368_9HYPH|nr:hypothetical protein [Phyllobacterium zundukense]ATU94390.1 hypothetical protein BLM14_21870 [Phyllobacterium zundukense]PIO46186.1 hypothetical protein B5P45_03485 [Phyllobacterium zundukense]
MLEFGVYTFLSAELKFYYLVHGITKTMFRRRYPLSVALFLFTAVAFLLQAIPFIGVFFWMLQALFWGIITINLAFLLIPFDCAMGRLPKWCLIIPVLWFGGYFFAHVASQHQARAFLEDALAANSQARMAPLTEDEDVVIHSEPPYALTADNLMENFDISHAFEPVDPRRSYMICGKWRSIRIQDAGCPELKPIEEMGRVVKTAKNGCITVAAPFKELNGATGYRDEIKGVCRIRGNDNPGDRKVTVRVRKGPPESNLLGGEIQTVRIERAGGETVTFTTGKINPLPLLPRPIVGCFFGCMATFYRPDELSIENRDAADTVAAVLGLRKATVSQRYPQSLR